MVAVEEVDDNPAAIALVEGAAAVLRAGIGEGPNALSRAWSFVRREPPKLGFGRLVCARVSGASGARSPLFVVAHEIAALMAIPTRDLLLSERPLRPEAAVNAEHPHFRALLRLWGQVPDLAAYALAKALVLDGDRGLEFDVDLISAAARCE